MDAIDETYISNALNDLLELIGIREDADDNIVSAVQEGGVEQALAQIANHLGLPVKINLVYVPDDYQPSFNDQPSVNETFSTRELVETDSAGRGINSIVAQVLTPSYLPLYGSPSLTNLPITVKINNKSVRYPWTFVTVMAHELSHVVLRSLRSRYAENEIYTDLTSLLLGFSGITFTGRQVSETENEGFNRQKTVVTTYGYLTDEHFSFAYRKIRGILENHKKTKKYLIKKVFTLEMRIEQYKFKLLRFKKYLNMLDHKRTAINNSEDGNKIISFHRPGFLDELKCFMDEKNKKREATEKILKETIHYRKKHFDDPEKEISTMTVVVEEKTRLLNEYITILSRYIGLLEKMSIWFRLK